EEPVGRVVVGPRECRARRADEHLGKVRGHRLGAVGPLRQRHRRSIARTSGFPTPVSRRRLTAMSGYAASARIDHGRPHAIAARAAITVPHDSWQQVTSEARVVDATPREQAAVELRWDAFRERWSQLWFFVRDPESWR